MPTPAPFPVAECIASASAEVGAAWTEFCVTAAEGKVVLVQQTPTIDEGGKHTLSATDTLASVEISNLASGNSHSIWVTFRESQASGEPSQQIKIPAGSSLPLDLAGTGTGRTGGPRIFVYGHADGIEVEVKVATFKRRTMPQ